MIITITLIMVSTVALGMALRSAIFAGGYTVINGRNHRSTRSMGWWAIGYGLTSAVGYAATGWMYANG